MDKRLIALQAWTADKLQQPLNSFKQIAGDASFRRYFRVEYALGTVIAMDAPPQLEDSQSFVTIATLFQSLQLNVPALLAVDLQQGFLLISDLGKAVYLPILSTENADHLYRSALDELIKIASCSAISMAELPLFDCQFISRELYHFSDWFLRQYCQLSLSSAEQQILANCFDLLINNAESQPKVCTHRDYHSRNLMWLSNGQVGILDFQDAVRGPITYDLASLIRDCYIDWPQTQVRDWALYYKKCLIEHRLLTDITDETFLKWFDLMGIQRHLKAIFIFARKYLRDNDANYLADIPRALRYIDQVSSQYQSLNTFHQLLTKKIMPKFEEVYQT